jgi:hypothetical protein
MKPAENIEKLITNAEMDTNAKMDQATLDDVLKAFEDSKKTRSATPQPNMWRTIMKSRIVRLAAGIVIVVALLGIKILTYLDTDVGSERIVAAGNLGAEIISIRQMAAARDVVGLASMLSQGRFESKLVAANFLTNMGSLPALEALSMRASGDLILEAKAGKLVLGSANAADWLEVSGNTLLTGSRKEWEALQQKFANERHERDDLERELSRLSQSPPRDLAQLRKRLAQCNETLDLIDGAVYVSSENGLLKLHCPTYHATALAELANGMVRVESHGHIVEANSVTLLHELRPVLTGGPPLPTPGWRERFDKLYSLDEGEVLRWVRTPFIPERQIYATQELDYYFSSTGNPPPPGYLYFWQNGKLYNWTLAMFQCDLALVLHSMGLNRYEYSDRSEKLVRLKLGGDWIERKNAPMEDKLSALEKILEDELGRKIRFEKRKVNRDGIIVRGQYKRVLLENVERPDNIYIYTDLHTDIPGPEPINGGGNGSVAKMIERVGSRFNRPVVFETEDLPDITVSWHNSQSYGLATANAKTSEEKQQILDSVLENLSRQTSLQFEYGQCEQDVWFITEQIKAEQDRMTD